MGILGVYRAVYDYSPQTGNELGIREGDLVFVLEKSTTDDWWKAKKRAGEGEEEEPEGLIPNNYVEEVCGFKEFISACVTIHYAFLALFPPY